MLEGLLIEQGIYPDVAQYLVAMLIVAEPALYYLATHNADTLELSSLVFRA